MSPSEDDKLRFLFASVFERSAPADDCPETWMLLDTMGCRLPEEQRTAIVDHLARCPVCAEIWRLAKLGAVEGE
jgi:hypothetical protein